MFTDTDFTRDRNSDAYKLVKPSEAKKRQVEDVDSLDEAEEEEEVRGNELNKLFGNKGQQDSDDE